ncbi:MAG: RND transporter [Curvibacter sp. RIFCSPHIGHO2_12_FULL_63_18]|uniref:efflux RND transporter permease subunit n=1 Tax=Rhodoferax sp. TaxID=50421 RepID=UPI0008D1B411|nr:efflux RND transporter permease subunit [Rhodoferax sp.]OGO99844.1 MAG: RND transporter [Curvibacter sp. GWA2_63_95]OGP06578.1 MAG: RND transporter [Curvibacter sp. RIFCSPHIGHO2_12_FULL_63_18]HCX82468.1 RND transporter [Rhodoferax sp.]
MNVSAWSIKNPIPAVMLFVLLTLAGIMSFNAMKVQQFPDLELPTVTVSASLPGAAPAQLETEVARKLENAIAPLQGLKNIYTSVRDGSVSVTAEFRLEKPTQEAVDDVRSAVQSVRSDLPSDVRDPIVSKMNLSGAPILAFTIRSSNMDDEALSWFVDNTISRALLGVRGVGSVARVGGVTREVQVALDPLKLQALGATAADVSRQLKQVQTESAGGRADLGGSEQPMRTLATVATVEELSQLELSLSSGKRVRLDEVATVKDTVAEQRSLALLNGKSVVGFEITRSKGASEVEVGAAVTKALADLKAQHPDLELTQAFDFVTPVQEEFDASMTMLYEGAVLAVIVVWFFLRSWRATLVSAVALPLSAIPAFIGMNYMGFTTNIVTLLALSLVIGILVDDAIVEVENIERHLRMGKTPYQAAMEAADEIGLAVIATTFALIAVFLPTAFMSGVVGKFFKQFGWTAVFAVFASLVVARVLTPMMAAYIMKPSTHVHEEPVWMPLYLRMTRWTLTHRWTTMFAAVAFFVGSLFLVPLIPSGFIPPDDNSQTQVYVELPPGSTLVQTYAAAEHARSLVGKVAHVKSIYTTIGGGAVGSDPFQGGATAEVRKATLTVLLDERGARPVKQVIESQMRAALAELPGARFKVGLGGSGEKYQLALKGEDPVALAQAAAAVERDLRKIPGLGNISSSASLTRAEIAIRPDFAKAADMGVTSNAIAETLRIATVGDYESALSKLNLSQRQVPIVVKLDTDARQDLELLGRLMVPGVKGPVMLSQVAALEMSGGPAVISRLNRVRNVNFEVELSGVPLGEVTEAVAKLPSIVNMPAGVQQLEVGDAEVQAEMVAGFGMAMLTGVLCIYIVLVLLFKDFLHPISIIPAVILSFGGAFMGLLVTGKMLSMPSFIGLVMLIGVSTKNSILLVEYAIMAQREHGLSRFDALMDACHKRARPIIMTTIAMVAGMLPLVIGLGSADNSFRAPMAAAVIGGLITSTILSLLVTPSFFTIVDDIEHFVGRIKRMVLRQPTAPTLPTAVAEPH